MECDQIVGVVSAQKRYYRFFKLTVQIPVQDKTTGEFINREGTLYFKSQITDQEGRDSNFRILIREYYVITFRKAYIAVIANCAVIVPECTIEYDKDDD